MSSEDSAPTPAIETFQVGSSTYTIAPESGFRLMRWSLGLAGKNPREVLYWPDNDAEGKPLWKKRGGNPLLFPFSARSFDRGLENHWRAPDGERRPMPRHGFARSCSFTVKDRSDSHIEGELVPDEAAAAAYPYAYRFRAAYHFEELALKIIFTLTNKDSVAIPWSAGHHFYFTLPWHESALRENYRLNMEARKCAYHGPDGKLVMEKDREACHDLSDTTLLDRIHWELRHNRVSFGPKGGEEDVHIILGDEPVPKKGYTIVTWSESETAPYYCVEPWMGPPNAAEHGKGLHWVGPGETDTFAVTVSLY